MTVQDVIISLVLPKLKGQAPTITAFAAVQEAVNMVASSLARHKSDLVQLDTTINFIQNVNAADLPTGFIGMAMHPCINGTELSVATRDVIYDATLTGPPRFYRQRGTSLFLYPTPTVATTLQAVCNVTTVFEGMADEMPWFGQFNLLVADVAVRFAVGGAVMRADQALVAMVEENIAAILEPRKAPLPRIRRGQFF